MPITTIDPVVALLVIDLQAGFTGAAAVDPVSEIAARAGQLANTFRDRGLPVVLVNVVGGAPGRTDNSSIGSGPLPDGWADLLPELGRHKSDHTISKVRWVRSMTPGSTST